MLLCGEFVSSAGNGLYTVAIMVYVFGRTGSVLALGAIGACLLLPFLILSVPAGVAADRFDRRRVLIATDLIRALAVLFMIGAVLVDASLFLIVGLAFVVAVVSAFFGPAFAAYLPDLVSNEHQYAPANAAWAMLENAALVGGPALAGLLIAAGGTALALLADVATFGVVLLILVGLPARRHRIPTVDHAQPPGGPARSILALLRPAMGSVVVQAAVGFAMGGLLVLTVVVARGLESGGDPAVGYLMAALGAGGVLGGFVAAPLAGRSQPLALAAGALLTGCGLVLLSGAGRLPVATLAMAVAGSGAVVIEVITLTVVQRTSSDEFRGRALGLAQTIGWAAYASGQLLMPAAAAVVDSDLVLVVAGTSVVVLGLGGAWLARASSTKWRSEGGGRPWLADLDLFRGFPAERLAGVFASLQTTTVLPGQAVIRQGAVADRLFIVESGSYEVHAGGPDGRPQLLRRLGPHDVFGEIGLLENGRRTATVTALETGSLLTLGGGEFGKLVAERPSLRSLLLGRYAG